MTEVYSLYSEHGDEYKLQFTTDRSGIIAEGHVKDFGKPEEEQFLPFPQDKRILFSVHGEWFTVHGEWFGE